MAEVSRDATPPKMGPGFLKLTSLAYRVEMGAFTLILFATLFYWRLLILGDLDLLQTLFWFLFPDLAAFIPIGLAMRGGGNWPSWGASLYNTFHTFLVWLPVFAGISLLLGTIAWPLLARAGHITMDRAAGYYLRAPA